eukprot:TRINITY_DN2670_c3_g1_i2.p1 TRINITY_DN2670_c3_g1~~TRINITY_DN2670_c3_g1_i2.p1  ORF type:complete len:216 (-),score=55.46 TRINITY_DN2670_c3_g1_i2:19-666(-)
MKNSGEKAYYEKDFEDEEDDDVEYQDYLKKKTAPQSRDEQLHRYRKQKNIQQLKKKLRSESDLKEEDDYQEETEKMRFDPLRMFDLQWIRRFPMVNESITYSTLPMILGGYLTYKKSNPINRFRNSILGSSVCYFVSLPIIFTTLFHRYTTIANKILVGEPNDFNSIYVSEEGIMDPDDYEATRPIGPDGGIFGDIVKYPKNLNNFKYESKIKQI